MLKLYTKMQTVIETLKSEDGQDMIEYVLLAALVGLVVAVAIPTLTNAISAEFGVIAAAL
jgi:Flp pilus assembly pilin Flp